MIVESTIVPARTCRPRAARCALIVESFNGRLRDEFLAVEQFDRRDPEMQQTRKGRQWFFGMKLHTGTDARTGLVHSLSMTAANVSGVTGAHRLLHGGETAVWGHAGYQGAEQRPEHAGSEVSWQVAMRPGLRRQLAPGGAEARAERRKAAVRAKAASVALREAALRVRAVRYRGLEKDQTIPRTARAGPRAGAATPAAARSCGRRAGPSRRRRGRARRPRPAPRR